MDADAFCHIVRAALGDRDGPPGTKASVSLEEQIDASNHALWRLFASQDDGMLRPAGVIAAVRAAIALAAGGQSSSGKHPLERAEVDNVAASLAGALIVSADESQGHPVDAVAHKAKKVAPSTSLGPVWPSLNRLTLRCVGTLC